MKSSNTRDDRQLVCDTGPLLALARINFLDTLQQMFPRCFVTETVLAECTVKHWLPDAVIIHEAIQSKKMSVVPIPISGHPFIGLDAGEGSVLELARQWNCIALIDEKRGRELAKKHNVSVLGTLGVILLAKHQGRIDRAMPRMLRLAESGYYLDPVLLERCKVLSCE